MPVQSYRDLDVWQKAIQLVVECYRLTQAFPTDEQFGLTAQTRRAAISVASNIAEGHERRHLGDYRRHLSMSRGSIAEIETQFLAAEHLKYTQQSELAQVYALCDDVSRMLTRLRRALERPHPTAHRAPRTSDR